MVLCETTVSGVGPTSLILKFQKELDTESFVTVVVVSVVLVVGLY